MSTANAFLSYSHADEKALKRLHTHLAMLQREGSLIAWTDNAILPGTRLDAEISSNLGNSNLFVALISPDYLASNYCYDKEFAQATTLADTGKLRIVPVILKPCDWLSSPFKDFKAMPKDGKPISEWTNQNNAFLDVVIGLRQLLAASTPTSGPIPGSSTPDMAITGRRLIVKRDFDSIEKADFADRAYETIKNYFSGSCNELSAVGDALRAKFEIMDSTAFTCSVVNRAKIRGGEAHLTVRNSKTRGHFGDISFTYQRYAEANSSNGGYSVAADDYNLFLTTNAMNAMTMTGGSRSEKLSPEQAAEELWNSFVKQAGIEYE